MIFFSCRIYVSFFIINIGWMGQWVASMAQHVMCTVCVFTRFFDFFCPGCVLQCKISRIFCPVSSKPNGEGGFFAQWYCSHLVVEPRHKFGLMSCLVFLFIYACRLGGRRGTGRPASGLISAARHPKRTYFGLGGRASADFLAHGSVVFHIKIREMERGRKTRARLRSEAWDRMRTYAHSEVWIRSDSGTILAITQ